MKFLTTAVFFLPFLLVPILAHAAPVCPTLTNASSAYYGAIAAAGTNCNVIITINTDLTETVSILNTNPYDGSDDNYIGVVNNSAGSVGSIQLSSNTNIFGFDGDGIDAFGIAGNAIDVAEFGTSAYGGSDAYFTAINTTNSSATVNFIGGIGSGGSGYFSLEEAPTASTLTPGPVNSTVGNNILD